MSLLLRLENVSVTRTLENGETLRALEGVNWTWERGQTWALRGPNGSGKSTLLRVVRGELWPDVGGGQRTYFFDGTPRKSPLSVKDRVALISPESQDWYLSSGWAMSVRQVLETGFSGELLPHRTLSNAQNARLEEVAEQLCVQDWLKRDIRSLSNGQRRQVLLARALVGGPLALLLDEFFEGVDAASGERLRALMFALARQTPTLYTGHRDEGALEFATHELWLEGGRVVRVGEREGVGAWERESERVNERTSERVNEMVPAVAFPLSLSPSFTLSLLPDPTDHAQRPPLVELQNCTVRRGGKTVLEDVSWAFEPEQNWVLLGPNGAGKSTLARLARRELHPLHGGRVLHGGKPGGSSWDVWRRFPLVSSEATPLHRTLASGLSPTGFTLVASGFEAWTGYAPTLSEAHTQKVLEWMACFGVDHLARREASRMSAGEIKRCLLARALVNDPDVLILDEPFDHLDRATKRVLMRLIETLERTRFLLIAHRLEDLPSSATHLLKLEAGRVAYAGPLERSTV